MVMAATGSKSAAGATMKSAAQSNTKPSSGGKMGASSSQSGGVKSSMSSGVGGGNYASAGGGKGSGASYGGGSKTNTGSKISGGTNSNPSGARDGGGNGGISRGYGGGSTTSRIGSAASAQSNSAQASGNMGYKGGPPNAAAARASAALNAGLGRDPSPISGALNTSRSIAAPPSLPNNRMPAGVQNYLGSGTATPFGGYQYGVGQMYADPYRSRAALNSVLNNSKLAGHSPMQTSDAVLRSAGMTNPMARAGVLGTFDHESAGFNPNAVGDQGTAYGLGQWRGPRQAGLQRYSAGMGQPTGTVGVQTAYALTEMGRAYPKTLNSLQAAQDVQSAVRAMNAYERPRGYVAGGDPTAVAGWADRVARANAALGRINPPQTSTNTMSANAVEEMTRRAWVDKQIGALYADPAINIQLPNALGRGMWDLRVADATRVAQGQQPIGAFGERQMAPWDGAGFRTAEQAADNKRRGTGVGIDRSFHGVGLAADITVPRIPGESTKQWENRNAVANQALAGTIDPSSGVTWGGSWSKPDLSHFQLGTGSQRQAAIDKYGTNVPAAGVRPTEVRIAGGPAQQESLVDTIIRAVTPAPTNTVPSWKQSTYTGPQNVVPSWRQSTYTGPQVTTAPIGAPENRVPSWQQSAYTGIPPNVPPSQREPLINREATPYKVFNSAVRAVGNGVFPGVGTLAMKGVDADINRINQMTPAEQAVIKARWATENRAYLSGGISASRSDNRPAIYVPPSSQAPQASSGVPETPASSASGNWQADALAYGYSEAQLNDPEIRALIKELWDMGFIPKTSSA